MEPTPRPTWLPTLAWLLLAACTLWLGRAQISQTIDPGNQALKARDSADAERLRDLAGVIGSDQIVLLAFLVPGDLPMLPMDKAQVDACREQLLTRPGVTHCELLPSQSPGVALLAVSIQGLDLASLARAVVADARRLAPAPMQVLATGVPLVESTIADLVAGERRTIVPLLAVILFAVAWLLYRRAGLALAALLPALLGIVWTSGLVALAGHPLDPVAALLDPVLLTIGVATSVHFVEAWRRGIGDGKSPRQAGDFASAEQRTPTLLATATTMVGLLSMATSPVPAVVDFGIRAAFGVALVHTFTFVLLPGWLARQRPSAAPDPALGWRRAQCWQQALRRRRGPLLMGTVAITVLALAYLPALRADNDPLLLLPADEATRVDHDALTARLGGVEVCHLYVPARSPGTDPQRLLGFVAATQLLPGIAGMAGPVRRGPEGDLAVPLLLQPGGSAVREPLFADLERGARVLGLDGVVPAGVSVQIARDSAALMQSLIGSTLLTLLLLAVGMCVGLRSWRLGLLGMIPNLLPCLWVYGGLACADRPVSVATGMIGCTMLGLIVDNSLHLLHQYRHVRQHASARHAVTTALHHCGRPIWLSSGLLLVGFATAATSRLNTTIEFSLLACSTIAAALFGCGVLLPLLLDGRRDRALPRSGDAHGM